MRWLELNAEGIVINISIWDGVTPYTPAGVAQLLPCDDNPGVSFGWRIVDGAWEAPVVVEEVVEEVENGES
jgi:hypothetical protein